MSLSRIDGSLRNTQGEALSGISVYVCTEPNSVPSSNPPIPPSPLASIFSDLAGTQPITQPLQTDGNGNYDFYATPGTYTIVYFDTENRIPTVVFPNQTVATPGGGSVSSVGLVVPSEFTVSGSPVTGNGTITIAKGNIGANLVAAGPSSGPSAQWTFRTLVLADLPSGVGTVSSVALTVATDANMTKSVTGSPVTSSGTLAITLALANQNANSFLRGPTSGSSGPTVSGPLVPADLPAQTNVAFSATPAFDASTAGSFRMVLTGNVTSSSVANPSSGQRLTFILIQDATGSRTFAWPANFRGATAIAPDANLASVQSFVYDATSTVWRADGPGLVMAP
jgi:hypothetical protein